MKHALAPNGFCAECGVNEGSLWGAPHHLRPRSVLGGRYVVGKAIGEGGFGITYAGWDTRLSVKVAIKEYYPSNCVTRDINDGSTVYSYGGGKGEFFQTERKRFIDEAQRLARFGDLPGIVSVKDFFEENGTAYIVMEFVEGATLKTVLTNMNGSMQEAHVLEMMKPLIKSLAEVHNSGIIHRDIAPDNIMIRPDGSVKLIDFGAAREADAGGQSIVALMKHGYTPEEQYDTDRSRQGAWSDVYALCATIFRAIEGAAPPDANTRLRSDMFSGFTVSVGENTRRVILKGLAVKPEQRWRDMGELARELYAATTTATTVVAPAATGANQPPGADISAPKAANNKKWLKPVAVGGGLVALVLIVLGIIGLLNKPPTQVPEDIPAAVATPALPGGQANQPAAVTETPEPTPTPVYAPTDPGAEGNSCGNVTKYGGGIAVESGGWVYYSNLDQRGYIYRMKPDGSDQQQLNDEESKYINVIGEWLYFAEYGVTKMKTDGSAKETLINDLCYSIYVAGDWIYYINSDEHGRLYKMKTDGSAITQLTEDVEIDTYFIVDGWIYYQADLDSHSIWKIKAADGSGKAQLPLDDEEYYLYFNVVGEWIYYYTGGGIHKIKTDGSGYTLLTEFNFFGIADLNVQDGWAYYSADKNYGGNNLYRVRTDGSDNMQLTTEYCVYQSIDVSGDWVYFKKSYSELYRVSTDGSLGPMTMDGQVDESTSASIKSGTEFYEEWPDLPDFGYACSIPMLKKQAAGQGMFYIYDLASMTSTNARFLEMSMSTYGLKLSGKGFSSGTFDNEDADGARNLYFANKNGTCFYFFIDTVDEQLCPVIYAFDGPDSYACQRLNSSPSSFPVYSGNNAPDFGAAFGLTAKKSTEEDETIYSYDKSLFSDMLMKDFVEKYIKILTDAGFSRSAYNLYKKGGTSVELRGIDRNSNVTGANIKIVIK